MISISTLISYQAQWNQKAFKIKNVWGNVSIGARQIMTEKLKCASQLKHLSFNNVRLKNPEDELRIFKSNIAEHCLKIYSKKQDRTETKI